MGRKKIKIVPITDNRVCMATFHKRRYGLFKKAQELGILCNCEIALVICTNQKKVYQYTSHSTLAEMMEKIADIVPEESFNMSSMNEHICRRSKKEQEENIQLNRSLSFPNMSNNTDPIMFPHTQNTNHVPRINSSGNNNIPNHGQMANPDAGILPCDYPGKNINHIDLNSPNPYPYSKWPYNPGGVPNGAEIENFINQQNQNYALLNAGMNGNIPVDVEEWKRQNGIHVHKNEFVQSTNNNIYQEPISWPNSVSGLSEINFSNHNGVKDEQQYNAIFRDQTNGYLPSIANIPRIPQRLNPNNQKILAQKAMRVMSNQKDYGPNRRK